MLTWVWRSWPGPGVALHSSPSSLCPGVLTLCVIISIVIVSLPAPVSTARPKSQETGFSSGPPRLLAAAACAGRGTDNTQGQPGDKQGAEKGGQGLCFPSCVTLVFT